MLKNVIDRPSPAANHNHVELRRKRGHTPPFFIVMTKGGVSLRTMLCRTTLNSTWKVRRMDYWLKRRHLANENVEIPSFLIQTTLQILFQANEKYGVRTLAKR